MAREVQKLQIIPLGGLGEIGKNMTVVRYGDDILVIDAGLMFPEEEMLGIDLVIPDITYLLENKDKIRAIVLTHGHEDHIGALPYVLRQIPGIPVYGTRLTLGILEGRLRENGVDAGSLHPVYHGDIISAGCFTVGFIRVNHSIADACGLSIKTPMGMIVHTGDFKFDYTPIDGKMTDFRAFSDLGNRGVLALLADSTNAEREGHTPSERTVGIAFDRTFRKAKNRIIIATFSSNVHRIQQVVDTAVKYNRRVSILGRSMINVVNISIKLGYLNIPEGTLIDIDEINNYPPNQIVIITTGSQGEPMSALTRMSTSNHRKVGIVPGDTIIISATPIPGNEKLVSRTIDNLLKQGADVTIRDNWGRQPLHDAVKAGNIEGIQMLIAAGAPIGERDNAGNTPLHHAIKEKYEVISRYLLNIGSDVYAVNKENMSPLSMALLDPKVTEWFIDKSLLASVDNKGRSPLHIAIEEKSPEAIIQILVKKEAELDKKDMDGNTPLHYALNNGNYGAAKVIVNAGADIFIRNKDGMSPLYIAMSKGTEILDWLITDYNINLCDNQGNTPLHIAAIKKDSYIYDYLIRRGASPGLLNKDGYTALQLMQLR